jgi:3-methyladenine DNA glycosylase AlkD
MHAKTKDFGPNDDLYPEHVRHTAFLVQRLNDLKEGTGERLEQAAVTLKNYATQEHSILYPNKGQGVNLLNMAISEKFNGTILDLLSGSIYTTNSYRAKEIAVSTIAHANPIISNEMVNTVAKAPFETAFFTLHEAITQTHDPRILKSINDALGRIRNMPKSNVVVFRPAKDMLRKTPEHEQGPGHRPAA